MNDLTNVIFYLRVFCPFKTSRERERERERETIGERERDRQTFSEKKHSQGLVGWGVVN